MPIDALRHSSSPPGIAHERPQIQSRRFLRPAGLCPGPGLVAAALDGEPVEMSPAIAGHIAACVDCRGRFAAVDRLRAALAETAMGSVRPMLTERIVAAAAADSRRRRRVRRWSMGLTGLAAGIAAAIWIARPPAAQNPGPEVVHDIPPPDLQREIADAGQAVASITRRAAADAVAPAGSWCHRCRHRSGRQPPNRSGRLRMPGRPWPTGSNPLPRPPAGPRCCFGATCR